MKAVVIRSFGPAGVMRLEDVAAPVPGPDEVVIEVHAVSVNRTLDVLVRAGQYAHKPAFPHILGVDPSGVVAAVGADVADRKIGDRVVTRPAVAFAPNGAPQLLGVHLWGGYAEYVKVPANATHLIPADVDFPVATVVARHAPLAFSQLRDYGQLQAGNWVLVMGAAGGLGSAAVQVAKYLGGKVIAAAGSSERVRAAMELGADAGVDYRRQNLAAEVLRITGGKGADIVLENIGDPALFPNALASLARRGRLVTAGGHGGGTVLLDVKRLYLNELSIIGIPAEKASDYAVSLNAAAEGRFRVLIDRILPMSEVVLAHELVEARSGIGKVLLDPKR